MQVYAVDRNNLAALGDGSYLEIIGPDPGRRFWTEDPRYEPYLDEFLKRPEYRGMKKKMKK